MTREIAQCVWTNLLLLSACAVLPLSAAFAAGEIADEQPGIYTGRSGASASGCPTADWHITRLPGNKLGGVVLWADNSGISQATGSFDEIIGNSRLTPVSASGNGPVGAVAGSKLQPAPLHPLPGRAAIRSR